MADVPAGQSRYHTAAGRSYQDVSLTDSSRAHLGDVVNINNYSGPDPQFDEDKRWRGVQQALSFDSMDVRRRNIDPAYGDTCRWVLETEEYCRWRNEALRVEHHGFLWIKGNPGVGKSTIMKFLLEHAQAHFSGHVNLSFFFNARGNSLEMSTEGLYRSLLLQLLSKMPSLRSDVGIPDLDVQETQWSVKATKDLFREALLLLGQTPVTIFVDALDEGDQKEVRDLVGYFGKLATHVSIRNSSFNLCFASRHYPKITIRFCEELVVDGQPSHNGDIRKYVAENLVADLTVRRAYLERYVVTKAQGVFLWVVLVVSMLNEKFDRGFSADQLESTLNTIPEDLDGLFSDILHKGASDPYLLPALQSVIARVDSQTFGFVQLYFMILMAAGKLTSPVWDHAQADVAMMKRFILQSTKGLVEIAASYDHVDRVQFVHESVRQHLLGGGLTELYAFSRDNVEAHCHATLADCCQKYIRLIKNEHVSIEYLTLHEPSDPSARPKMELPLLHYAQIYTMWHVEYAHAGGVYGLKSLLNFPMTMWVKIDRYFLPDTNGLQPSTTLLYVLLEAKCFGLATEILEHYKTWLTSGPTGAVGARTIDNHLIDTFVGPDLNAHQGRRSGRTVLMVAAEKGHYKTVQLLLECGADIKSVTKDGTSALSLAIKSSHVDVVRLLLDFGAEIDHDYRYLGYPLVSAVAATSNNAAMVKHLLEHGADVNVVDRKHGTALQAAAFYGVPEIIKLLLLHGADPNIVSDGRDGSFDTALTTAAERENVAITKLLLLHGADVDLVSAPLSSSMREFVLSCREPDVSNEAGQLREV